MGVHYKKPTLEVFREVASINGGMLSSMAKALKVDRSTLYNWVKSDPEFNEVIQNHRMAVVDECFSTARLLAKGKPIIGEDNKFAGWEVLPDGNMVRFLLDRLGKQEGFGEEVKVNANVNLKGSVSIQSWLELNTQELDNDDELDE